MLDYDPETHVAVPKSELVKLEECRHRLFYLLENEDVYYGDGSVGNIRKCCALIEATQQIWRVANRKKWEQ